MKKDNFLKSFALSVWNKVEWVMDWDVQVTNSLKIECLGFHVFSLAQVDERIYLFILPNTTQIAITGY